MLSCSKETEPENNKDAYLVSSTYKFMYTEAMLETAISFPESDKLIKSGIVTYKLEYKTEYEGEEIIASGTLTIPDSGGDYPLVLIERGTILKNADAPSESYMPSYEFFAALGYVVFVPDLIGYGSSKDILHPYFDYNYTASASVDMYYAVNEYFESAKNIKSSLNGDFFITGYSQGGYSAMATFKYIEENCNEIDITAVGACAGGYDIMSVIDNVVKGDSYPETLLLVMPFVTYNKLYVNRPLTDIFNSPYDVMIQDVIDGETEWADSADSYPQVLAELFNSSLLDDFKNAETTFFNQAITENSVHDWAPQKPLRLYHYPPDEIIPLESTQSTLSLMQANGASDVRYVEIPAGMVPAGGSAHGSAGFPGLLLAFTEFATYNN